MIQKFRKKPVVIETIQFTGRNATEISLWAGREFRHSAPPHQMEFDKDIPNEAYTLKIDTLEGERTAIKMDWIIKGVSGEFYPCKPDIFEKTYESEQTTDLKREKEELQKMVDDLVETLKMTHDIIDLDIPKSKWSLESLAKYEGVVAKTKSLLSTHKTPTK